MTDHQAEPLAVEPMHPDLDPAREAIADVTAEMRRIMPNACGDWADRIDAALALTSTGVARMREECAQVARNHAAPAEVPQIDYDRACRDIEETIQALPLHAAADGWVMVPRVPTEAMVEAWAQASPDDETAVMSDDDANRAWARADWSAMIAAAPTPPLAKDQPHD